MRSRVSGPAVASGAFRWNRARWIPAAFLIGHLPDNQRTALDLLADQLELRRALLLGLLARRLHRITRRASVVETIPSAKPDSCLAPFSRNATNAWWRWMDINLLISPARSHVVGGRFAASAARTSRAANTTRTLHRSTRPTGSKATGVTIVSRP